VNLALRNDFATSREWRAASAVFETIAALTAERGVRRQMGRGEQVYFTYDPHWTELGHAVVAEEVARVLGPPSR
jgi:hypothetical protein